jgi:fructose-1,6-bisphosphatase
MTSSEINELKKFGYNVFEVTGYTNGKYCFELDNSEYHVHHSSYSVKKTKEKCWEAASRHYVKNFPQQRMALMNEKIKLHKAYSKAIDAIDKQIKALK